jgi:hypothetical protein
MAKLRIASFAWRGGEGRVGVWVAGELITRHEPWNHIHEFNFIRGMGGVGGVQKFGRDNKEVGRL